MRARFAYTKEAKVEAGHLLPTLSSCKPCLDRADRGTVILVSLCFVAVLGIMLAGYLALTSRVMNLSNRGFQAELSRQLAEAGIEEALRAFNKNDWSDWTGAGMDVNWDTVTYAANKRAVATISYPSGKFGQGVTAQVKVRVDNYDANVLGSSWSSSKVYRVGDQVGYNGLWYSCVQNHSNQAPSTTTWAYWVPTHVPWKWDSTRTYSAEEMVNYNGAWYRCIATNTNQAPPNANWTATPSVLFSPSIDYTTNAILNWYGTWYRYNAGSWDSVPAISWRYRTGYAYSFNDLVCYNNVWYRFINGTPTASITPGTNASYWENAQSGSVHTWSSSSINYSIGDAVYYSTTSQWYRCILAHTSSAALTPTNATYWTNSPGLSQQWKSGPYYAAGDIVSHNGVWYLCILTHTSSSSITPANTSYWIGANTTNTNYIWNSTTAYAANAYRCYGGVWYRCLVTNTGQSPNNTTYWSAAWSQSGSVIRGAPVVYAEATIMLGDNTTSMTQLRAPIAPAPLFSNAAGATTTLTIGAASGTVDSYDNSLGTTYASQVGSSTNFSSVLAASETSSTAVSVNNTTTIKGYVAAPSSSTSPYAPLVTFGGSTTVKNASSPVAPNVDPAQISRSPYVPQFSPQPSPSLSTAFSSWNFQYGRQLPTPAGFGSTLNIGTPGATTPSHYYYNGNLDLGSSYNLGTLNIQGPVVIYINGYLILRSGGSIRINASGSAEIHVGTFLRVLSASDGIINQAPNSSTPDPKNLILICDSSAASAQYYDDATNDFYGIIYAPNTTATLGFDIGTGVEIYGAISAREITFNTEANLHYDTSLRYALIPGVDQPYTVTQWRELDATEQATMP